MGFQIIFSLFLSLAIAEPGEFADPGPLQGRGGIGPGFVATRCSDTLSGSEPNSSPVGPRYKFKAKNEEKRVIESIKNMKVMSFNVLNLNESPGKYVLNPKTGKKEFVYGKIKKPEDQVKGICDTINRANPDIAVLTEVESLHALSETNMKCMHENYFVILIEGNDGRGIDIGYLIKKDLPFDLDFQSHKHIEHEFNGKKEKVFSRDFPVLEFRKSGGDPKSAPLFVFAGVHLKSQRDDGVDIRSVKKRTAQVEVLADISEKILQKWGKDVPMIIAGDFNADIPSSAEFMKLREKGFVDSFDVAGVDPLSEERITQSYFPRGADPIYSQLDGIFITSAMALKKMLLSIRKIPYYDENGNPKPLPKSYDERAKLPSDHWAIMGVFDFQKFLNPN